MEKRLSSDTSKDEEEEKGRKEEEEQEEKKTKKSNAKNQKKKKKPAEEEDEEEEKGRKEKEEDDDDDNEEEEEKKKESNAKPIGDIVKTTGRGRYKKDHYSAFECGGKLFKLEDTVLTTPDKINIRKRPSVAIIKDITQAKDGSMIVTGQRFYRPNEAEKRSGERWELRNPRELFYSFHRDEVPAEFVLHKCVVHFVPSHKQFPVCKDQRGFVVKKVYDTVERILRNLTDKDYEDTKQHEIDLLIHQTWERIGELPDVEPEDASVDQQDPVRFEQSLRRKNISPIDVTRDDDTTTKQDQQMKSETPGSCTSGASEFYTILANFKALTGDMHRDKCLEKLLQGIRFVCNSAEDMQAENKEKGASCHVHHDATGMNTSETADGSQEKSLKDGGSILWPDAAVQAVTALEKASHDALGMDFQKYNQKMQQLLFNLQKNALLARRLVNKELEPSVILNMSPNELKDGLTTEEKSTKEPESQKACRYMEKKVGVVDIIQAGGTASGDCYQVLLSFQVPQCIACGNTWYTYRHEISSLTIDAPSTVGNVSMGTVPCATSKFEAVEKKMLSPRESENPAADIFQKTTIPLRSLLGNSKII